MTLSILESLLILLLIAVVITTLFRHLKIPMILGYLVVGALVGPHGFSLVANTQSIRDLSEFGVVFLIFTIGLEFSLSKLWELRFSAFIYGGSQVFLTTAITTAVGMLLGMTLQQSIVIGGIVAMSSTAIVIKQLSEQIELKTNHGRNAIGILLFQDLAVIPLIVIITSLSLIKANGVSSVLIWALIKGVFAVLIILAAGQWLLRPMFRLISAARSIELFTLSVLLVTLGAAWLTQYLGLSLALGAFLAGIMLGETAYRQQIEDEIRPFRDVLLGLFFISIGMLLNIHTWNVTWHWILLLFAAIVIFKAALITILGKLYGYSSSTALRTGLALAQGGEFGFAILTIALTYNVLPSDYGQVVLGALLLSIGLSPVILYFNARMAQLILRKKTKN